ncbi:DUF932 domain-containing protein [Altererythrobacter sp. TH136]|uniref:DUF932 domain-containing protein n=1 Tax=Altererythrobacter sp. TH136 TaxID=2067415 RepID=UPI00143DFC7F|nr:DUF932 domain-containing protein [Altererythrobacter sp. TH136]
MGVVSPGYYLVQHQELGDRCADILRRLDLFYERLWCELELSALGEWMHLSLFLGDDFQITPADGHPLSLRIEIFNSVEGSSRLTLLVGWFRFVCANGLVIGNTLAKIADVHDERLDLRQLEHAVTDGLKLANVDRKRLNQWSEATFAPAALPTWADGPLAAKWGKKAAARCLHICRTGYDAEFAHPFQSGLPSERELRETCAVPGSATPSTSLYDVAQALSWIATNRTNVEERLAWQSDVPPLVSELNSITRKQRVTLSMATHG